MKIYISADIEGVAGITDWSEADYTHPSYPQFREEMTREVVAACDGAMAAGATEILVKDAHHTGRNILAAQLPACARLVRGWSGHPLAMVQELDESFAAVLLIGYHARAGAESNPLAHTISLKVAEMRINGEPVSEFRLHTFAAALLGVPVAFVSGDEGLCQDVAALNERIRTVGVSQGRGPSTISLAPATASRRHCARISPPRKSGCRTLLCSRSGTPIPCTPISSRSTRAPAISAARPSGSRPATISRSCGRCVSWSERRTGAGARRAAGTSRRERLVSAGRAGSWSAAVRLRAWRALPCGGR